MSELEVAKKSAMQAGKMLIAYYSTGATGTISSKGVLDKVTDADKESERLIQKEIKQNFPFHGFTGEELGETKGKDIFSWYVDPLCGTFNFIHGLPEFAVSIGLAKKDEIILGVVYVPVYNELFWAEKGKGAFMNDKKIMVSKTFLFTNAMLSSDFGSNPKLRLRQFNYMNKIIPRCEYLLIGGSFPYQLTRLAMGKIDRHIKIKNKIIQ